MAGGGTIGASRIITFDGVTYENNLKANCQYLIMAIAPGVDTLVLLLDRSPIGVNQVSEINLS